MAGRRRAPAGAGLDAGLDALWAQHHAQWRDPAQVASQWQEAAETDPALLRASTRGRFWEALAEAEITLLVSREYEHLLMALRADQRGPTVTFMRMPHPSGIAVDRERGTVHVASTRNPNQVYDLQPAYGLVERLDRPPAELEERPLVPVRSRFLPGCLYLHDLAMVGGRLCANAVGQNAVIRLDTDGGYTRAWWPRAIEQADGPVFGRNHLQLNSIAAGPDLAGSYFSASTDTVSARRPGHRNFPVNRRGVIFSGATREPIARGLTRPHSARLHQGQLWVDNSGYGELCLVRDGRPEPVVLLPGWTRGLCFFGGGGVLGGGGGLGGGLAFVGTSRVIPRFRQYAPGLDVDASRCGVHAVDLASGQVVGSLLWPSGNQIFALDWLPAAHATGFPFRAGSGRAGSVKVSARTTSLFYAFQTQDVSESDRVDPSGEKM